MSGFSGLQNVRRVLRVDPDRLFIKNYYYRQYITYIWMQIGQKSINIEQKRATLYKNQYEEYKIQSMRKQPAPRDQIYYAVSTRYLAQYKSFCTSPSIKRQLPDPMNHDLFEAENVPKSDLIQGEHFEIFRPSTFQLLKVADVQIHQIKVKAYRQNEQIKCSLSPIRLPYLLIFPETITTIRNDTIERQIAPTILQRVYFSPKNTLKQYVEEIRKEAKIDALTKIKLWKINKKQQKSLWLEIRKRLPDKQAQYSIPELGDHLPNLSLQISQVDANAVLMLECIKNKQLMIFHPESKFQCSGCFEFKQKLPSECPCKTAFYCSQGCRINKIKSHQAVCPDRIKFISTRQKKKKIADELTYMTKTTKPGELGFKNLGNTCYMNACLQIFSNTMELTQYLLIFSEEQFQNLKKKKNLVTLYRSIIKKIWIGPGNSIEPHDLKQYMAKVNPMFSGYEQHDSQEFFIFFLARLREQLNRGSATNKFTIGAQEERTAYTTWKMLKMESIVDELFMGLYRSSITCLNCLYQSVTFEPYNTISLQIPERKGNMTFYLVEQYHQDVKKMSHKYFKVNGRNWVKDIAYCLNKNPENFLLYFLTIKEQIYDVFELSSAQILKHIAKKRELFLLELSKEEIMIPEQNRVRLIIQFAIELAVQNEGSLWLKRPLIFDKENMTTEQIFHRIYQYLFYGTNRSTVIRDPDDNGAEYEAFLKQMIGNPPLKFYLKWKKVMNNSEILFNKKELINSKDFMELIKFKNIKFDDCELEIRVNKNCDIFNFDRLKRFKEPKIYDYDRKNQQISLTDCIKTHLEAENLDKNNQWLCPQCKQKSNAAKQIQIEKVPDLLIFHLKRFKNLKNSTPTKNQVYVTYDFKLDMTPFVRDTLPITSFINECKKQQAYLETKYPLEYEETNEAKFELYGNINHYGSINGGHYTAQAMSDGEWKLFDDSKIQQVLGDQLKTKAAYMLCYRRKY